VPGYFLNPQAIFLIFRIACQAIFLILKTFRDRLIENGKTKLQAVIASMRKLLQIIYEVLTTQQPFDPNHQSKTQAKQTQCPAAT
jgi:hypothetical protein